MKRKSGYYWIKCNFDWHIGLFTDIPDKDGFWRMFPYEKMLYDEMFNEINETPITYESTILKEIDSSLFKERQKLLEAIPGCSGDRFQYALDWIEKMKAKDYRGIELGTPRGILHNFENEIKYTSLESAGQSMEEIRMNLWKDIAVGAASAFNCTELADKVLKDFDERFNKK